ncbi:MAG: glycerophosphodiester phosphodiesterase [Lacrimispora sp.]
MKNFAHRGFSGKYPENTLLAFQKALFEGVDGIELDVQLTSDGEVVIIHDETVDRTTDGEGPVVSYTLKELKKLDASYIYTGTMGFNPIPTLREYFELVKDFPIVTNVELKTGINEYPGLEEKVYELIKEYHLEDRIIISSFNHYSVLRMKEIAPELVFGFLSDTWIYNPGEYTKACKVACYHPSFVQLKQEIVDEIKAAGIVINTWTVNTEEEIRDLYAKGIDTVIGNYPDLTARVLKELENQ